MQGKKNHIRVHWNSEEAIQKAKVAFDGHRYGDHRELTTIIEAGLAANTQVTAACLKLHPIAQRELRKLAALQILPDLAELVLPKVEKWERPNVVLQDLLRFEVLAFPKANFLRWMISMPGRYLVGYLDQVALAARDLEDRKTLFFTETSESEASLTLHNRFFTSAGLTRVTGPEDLTPDHVLVMGAFLSVQNYEIRCGQPAVALIVKVQRTVLGMLVAPKATNLVDATIVTKNFATPKRGHGFLFPHLVKFALEATQEAVATQRVLDIELEKVARKTQAQEDVERRIQARQGREEGKAAAQAEANARAAMQRAALVSKSDRARARWEEQLVHLASAEQLIDARNEELLAQYNQHKQKGKESRKVRKAKRRKQSDSQERDRFNMLRQHYASLPEEIQDTDMRELFRILQQDSRTYVPNREAIAFVAQQDILIRNLPGPINTDYDFLGIIETWLRNEFQHGAWLEHFSKRMRSIQQQQREARILEARELSENRHFSLEEARSREAQRFPGSSWSEHLRLLQTLDTDERIDRIKASGLVGPPNGFSTLERHLHGESTPREQRDYGRERWLDIGSAHAELVTLERFAFYRVSVRFARELPGVYNPDFLIMDTLSGLASEARIRPLDVKKVYLDRAEEGIGAMDCAMAHFSAKLVKASKQLAVGMHRYGGFDPERRATHFVDERGGTAYFILQNRRLRLTPQILETCHGLLMGQILLLDNQRQIEAVDCIIVYLDFVGAGRIWQRPFLALQRSTDGLGESGWDDHGEYIDHLTSEHNTPRRIGPPYTWPL